MFNIFVKNISYSATDDVVRSLFAAYGTVESVKIITNLETGQSRGFGFVEMTDPGAGRKAIAGLNGKDFEGRTLNVNEARPRECRGGERQHDTVAQRLHHRY
jgi:RNA recognition motif-containing protein